MQRVDLGIDWAGIAKNSVEYLSDEALNCGSFWINEAIENSPYYRSTYKCPRCDDDRAVLYKLKLKDGIRTRAPKAFNGEIGLWNIFTCVHCGSWYASLNYIEGVYDLTKTSGYQYHSSDFNLSKICLFSAPGSPYDEWLRRLNKTLELPHD